MTPIPISVIVCTHNRAVLLPNVITQLCNQDYPPDSFEIIIVDNSSTDNTMEVVQRFKPHRKLTLCFVQEPRLGVTFARNRGAEEAHYSTLAYLDDDCSVGRDWLSQLVSGFGLSDKVSVVAGSVRVDIGDQKMPAWLGHQSMRWLADFNFPGAEPRLLENPSYVCEGNMAIKKQAWQNAGGFLGMDQFGSPHVASQEIIYLLEQIKRQGGQVAFVPGAIANHQTVIPSWWQLLGRTYFHGISTAILDHLLGRFSGISAFFHFLLDVAALFVFLFLSLLSLLLFDLAAATFHLLRAARRLGKMLGNLHVTGDWRRVKAWISMKGKFRQQLLGKDVS
ncbi:MAG: glycosyltransferase family 2 protein [Anaerolineae bacterium]|nr:glycosyltransferase family 2 protein [Anaerolineae bacterium]